jgi:hypothetical protein
MRVKDILEVAETFEKSVKTAAGVDTFQAGDIQVALEKAGLWEKSNEIGALLGTARVPENASVAVSIMVGKGPQVSFNVALTPPNPALSMKLSNMLKAKYATAMKTVIQKAFGALNSTYVLKWMTF